MVGRTCAALAVAVIALAGCSSAENGSGRTVGGTSVPTSASAPGPSGVVGGSGGISEGAPGGIPGPGSSSASSPAGSPSTPGSPSGSHSGSSSGSSGSSSGSTGGSGSGGDWTHGVNLASLPHPDLDCSGASGHGAVDVLKVVKADVTGDGRIDAIVREECRHDASEWPDSVLVYSHTAGSTTLVGTLLRQADSSYAPGITPGNRSVTLTTATWSATAPGCCPDLRYRTVYTWTGSTFTAGPRTDVLHPCAAEGDSLDVTTRSLGGDAGHAGIVLVFHNHLPQACTLTGYPGLDAEFSGGATVHAARTPSGYMGGPGHVSTVTLPAGGSASARLEWSDVPTGSEDCSASSTDILVTAPNTSDTRTVHQAVGSCSLQIHPVVAGSDG